MRPRQSITRAVRFSAPFALIALVGCASDDTVGESSDAGKYCADQGGTVETRQPYWGTNLDQNSWTRLPGEMELCRFDDGDGSRIYVDALSLSSSVPSLAASAYLAKLPVPSTTGGANPAAIMCQDTVGGTSSWGTGVNGGGWVNLDDSTFTVVDLCVFADGSAIDQWGIAYYSGDVIRGADLAGKFVFDHGQAAVFTPDTTN